jgi:hypothetical protein
VVISWKNCRRSENWFFIKGKLDSLCRSARVTKGLNFDWPKKIRPKKCDWFFKRPTYIYKPKNKRPKINKPKAQISETKDYSENISFAASCNIQPFDFGLMIYFGLLIYSVTFFGQSSRSLEFFSLELGILRPKISLKLIRFLIYFLQSSPYFYDQEKLFSLVDVFQKR